MNKTTNDKKNIASDILESVGSFLVHKWHILVLFLLGFLAATAISYLDASTAETVASYALDEYEVGQIANKTIFATKSMSADEQYPFAIEEGEKIIRNGFPITDKDYLKLKKMAESPIYIDYRAFADRVVFLMLVAALWWLLFSPVLLKRSVAFKELLLECLLFLIVFAAASFCSKTPFFQTPYALCIVIPASLSASLVAILFGQISALYFSFILFFAVLDATALGANSVSQLVPAIFTLASALSAMRIVRHSERRIDLVFASIVLACLNAVYITVLKVICNDNFADAGKVLSLVAFNGFISGILVLGLLTPLETLLNTASVFRLMDLSDLNTPVMRRMLLNASGTYNHSMLVATLAENACKEIGANALLARVGAYYHDLGKMEQPEYFVENQGGGENKHDDINPSLSASIIKSHVKRGVEKAHQLRLPQQIVDIIAEHHGNSVLQFFYAKAKEKDDSVSPEDFAYPGNPPTTVESAVVMIADTVESACRTLDKPSVPRLDKFIQTLIQSKIDNHQLDNCPLTFGELTKIRESFVQVLAGYYHSRIKYPNQKDPDAQDAPQQGDAAAKAESAEKNAASADGANEADKKKEGAGDKKAQKKAKTEKTDAESAEEAPSDAASDSAPDAPVETDAASESSAADTNSTGQESHD